MLVAGISFFRKSKMPFTATGQADDIDYDTAEHRDHYDDEMTERRQLRDKQRSKSGGFAPLF